MKLVAWCSSLSAAFVLQSGGSATSITPFRSTAPTAKRCLLQQDPLLPALQGGPLAGAEALEAGTQLLLSL